MNSTPPLFESGFLGNASDDLRDLMTALAVRKDLRKGETLFVQGDQGETLYAVLSGALEVSVTSPEGRKLSLQIMHKGAVFGEICLFDPGPRTATITALKATSVLGIRNSDVLKALRDKPRLNIDMIQLAGKRLRWMGAQLNEQVFLPLPARLARKILHLTGNGQTPTDKLVMSQSDLAEFVGASREAVSKTLSIWKADGVIDLNRGGLILRDRNSLTKIANIIDF